MALLNPLCKQLCYARLNKTVRYYGWLRWVKPCSYVVFGVVYNWVLSYIISQLMGDCTIIVWHLRCRYSYLVTVCCKHFCGIVASCMSALWNVTSSAKTEAKAFLMCTKTEVHFHQLIAKPINKWLKGLPSANSLFLRPFRHPCTLVVFKWLHLAWIGRQLKTI